MPPPEGVLTGCPECQPELAPAKVRLSEAHFGVQFDWDFMLTATLDGELVKDASEVLCGPDGWAIRYLFADNSEPPVMEPRLCPCGSGQAQRYKHHGDWGVTGQMTGRRRTPSGLGW